jgi:hypothetical protein
MITAVEQKKHQPRLNAHMTAKIVTPGQVSPAPCIVREISPAGAKLAIDCIGYSRRISGCGLRAMLTFIRVASCGGKAQVSAWNFCPVRLDHGGNPADHSISCQQGIGHKRMKVAILFLYSTATTAVWWILLQADSLAA